MTDLRDTIQVGIANGSAIGFSKKLNSTNPKYKPQVIRDDKVLRKLIKEIKGVKIYATYSI